MIKKRGAKMITCSQHIAVGKYSPKNLNYLVKMEKHNRRLFAESNKKNKGYVKELINPNKSYVSLYKETLEKWLALPIMEYNDNQKKANRKYDGVEGYISSLESSRNKNIAMEMIVQVADRNFWSEREQDRDKMEKVYRDYIGFLDEEFPNFKVISCTFHNDEDSPHIHIVGVPIAEFEKGLKMRVSQRNVFTKQEMERLQEKGRNFLEKSMQKWIDKDFRFDEKQKGRNHNYSIEALKENFDSFKEFNGINELREHKKMLSESILEMSEMLEKFDFMGVNNNKKKDKMKEVELRFEKFKNVLNTSVKTYSNELKSLQENIEEIRLEDTRIEEIKKGLTRETKKELGKIIRNNYVNSNEYNNFLEQVQEDLKIQMTNKLKRRLKQKELIEELEREREEFEKAKEKRNDELAKLDEELNKKKNTLTNMDNEISDLEEKKSIVLSELNTYKKSAEEYAKIVNDYTEMDIIKEYEKLKAENKKYELLTNDFESKNQKIKSEIEVLTLEKEKLIDRNTRLKSEIDEKQGIKEFENYFYVRGEEDLTKYFSSKGYDVNESRYKAQTVLEDHFSLEMMLALQEYALTGKMNETALYGEINKTERSDNYEKYDGRDEI